MYVKNQSFLILGVSRSGLEASRYLLKNGGRVYFYEEGSGIKIEKAESEIVALGGENVTGMEADGILSRIDVVVISPGVPINHAVAVRAKAVGKRIIGELELGYELFTPTFIAITGTNGKTTTATLLNSVLKESGIKAELVGNVGVPLTSKVETADKNTVFVTEVSSFQLESVSEFCPHISCILNISPDHLERHYNMENYEFLKKRITLNQKQSEYALLNFDDQRVRGFFPDIKAKVKWVSLKERVDGAYFEDGMLRYCGEDIMRADKLPLAGEHNIYNALFVIAAAKLMGAENGAIERAITVFKGVPCRMETIADKNGIKFVNDSKSTNTGATITALRATRVPAVLILGGSEKGEDYKELFEEIKRSTVKHVVLTGASRRNMLNAADDAGYTDITLCEDFDLSVRIAYYMAREGEEVLLSPACASFDKFTNYEERGERFKKIAEGLS